MKNKGKGVLPKKNIQKMLWVGSKEELTPQNQGFESYRIFYKIIYTIEDRKIHPIVLVASVPEMSGACF
ncbi:hypothetical protein PEDI_42830 [Persicobacter diffluens]|uniref:Uncharacterized protein n=1 Tax=Persicobacter diffluens TaxID=981 RepID=A0AAN5ANW5_9BACT|nr:hypothetical protein PEDI_42830 [Persicobacter diffluens]